MATKPFPGTLRAKNPRIKGAIAREWQIALNAAGANPELTVDEDAGNATIAALKAFQEKNNLKVDSIGGPATWLAVQNVIKAKAEAETPKPEQPKKVVATEAQVTEYYEKWIGRTPVQSEIDYWLSLEEAPKTVENAILISPEALGFRTQFVQSLYAELIKRNPTEGELEAALAIYVSSGGAKVAERVMATEEFKKLQDPAPKPAPQPEPKPEPPVTRQPVAKTVCLTADEINAAFAQFAEDLIKRGES